jgi:hypothetical protein
VRLPGIRIAVSIDGLRADHEKRRHPATYAKILENFSGRRVDISWVVTGRIMRAAGYLEEYLAFWTARPEVDRIWLNIHTPKVSGRSEAVLRLEDRYTLVAELPKLKRCFPALLMTEGIAEAFAVPPASPDNCTFAKMSLNYSAGLKTRVDPCFYGDQPDCSQCGFAVTAGLHWVGQMPLLGPLVVRHVMDGSIAFGSLVNQMRNGDMDGIRWKPLQRMNGSSARNGNGLVQLH